jgi:hypothetical protein
MLMNRRGSKIVILGYCWFVFPCVVGATVETGTAAIVDHMTKDWALPIHALFLV